MPSFYADLRSGAVDYVKFCAAAQQNVRDLPAPYTMTLEMLQDMFNAHGVRSDEMESIINRLLPGGPLDCMTVECILCLCTHGESGYNTDDDMKAQLGIE